MTAFTLISVTILGQTFTNDYHPVTGMLGDARRVLFFNALEKMVAALNSVQSNTALVTEKALNAESHANAAQQARLGIESFVDDVNSAAALVTQKTQEVSDAAEVIALARDQVESDALVVTGHKNTVVTKATEVSDAAYVVDLKHAEVAQNLLTVTQKANEAFEHADDANQAKIDAQAAAQLFVAGQLRTVARQLIAEGSTQADALQLSAQENYISTVPANAGVRMPEPAPGKIVLVANKSANPLKVYPSSGVNFNGLGIDLPKVLQAGAIMSAHAETSTTWLYLSSHVSDLVFDADLDIDGQSLTNVNAISPASPILITETAGNITVDFRLSTHYIQPQPTGAITYTFIPPEIVHTKFELMILNSGSGLAQVISMPVGTVWYGTTWAPVDNKSAFINGKWDGSKYILMGVNQA